MKLLVKVSILQQTYRPIEIENSRVNVVNIDYGNNYYTFSEGLINFFIFFGFGFGIFCCLHGKVYITQNTYVVVEKLV